jgi:DNA-binding CsgD family transcriptional regulator
LILTTSNQLVYQDRRAWELCALITDGEGDTGNVNNRNGAGKGASRVLPQVVKELCAEIAKLLQVWTEAKDWEEYRIERIVRGPDCGIHVSGLGLPGRESGGQSRVLITMEQIGRRHQPVEQAKELFGLTQREATVVQNLLKGWTNKEIGNELGVTEQTVKEHIKHIMAKTRTTTRTGILVRIMGL